MRPLLLMLCLAGARAAAQPYEIRAIYDPLPGSTSTQRVILTPGPDGVLPDGGMNHALSRIAVYFKPDEASRNVIRSFSKLKFTLSLGEEKPRSVNLDTAKLDTLTDSELTLVNWKGDWKNTQATRISVGVQAIYSREFLCDQERLLAIHLEEGKKQNPHDDDAQTAITSLSVDDAGVPIETPAPAMDAGTLAAGVDGGTSAAGRSAVAKSTAAPPVSPVPTRMSIRADKDGPLILYSFCRLPKNVRIDFQNLVRGPRNLDYFFFGEEGSDSSAGLLKAHKRALSKLLVERINKAAPSYASTVVDEDEPDYSDSLINVQTTRTFRVLKRVGAWTLLEESGGTLELLPSTNSFGSAKLGPIDQDSDVVFKLHPDVCLQLPPEEMMRSPWSFELEGPNRHDATKTEKLDAVMEFRDGCSRILKVSWKDYFEKEVTFRVIYRVPNQTDLVIFQERFHIYNLGLITTAPVVTEIISASQGSSLKDVEATSTMPLSLAIPVRRNRKSTAAVTFPFTVSFNTRRFPNLANYFALAPSISLIAGGPEEGAEEGKGDVVRVGIGMGVNVARAFHFGYAWTPVDGGRFILLGITVPELLPLFKGL
ncbi:hypothetical protein D7V93_07600 [Corallococcus llansteffanensis]|uniref:Uncharacterized protein n=1 Tax=Corallococcus llansteffanensis TaxID=2316731 RepID=A0A3A8Q6H3_9BACT|nr:hypothetical protein D7V93_07600 [Corallococcus llansteffanensis]